MSGAVQLFAPKFFYDNVPTTNHPWVSLIPPYSEHLMRDVGALTMTYAFVLAVAAVTMDRLMVRTALVANLIFAVPHFIFHAFHLEEFSVGDAIGQTISLGVGVLLPAACLALTWPGLPARRGLTRQAGR
ncbi:hypothetical protein EJK15_21240 [Nonomuraea basaltis]|nr:hypothetical protein EJK15_21240 [Nonomuraea basaltis]